MSKTTTNPVISIPVTVEDKELKVTIEVQTLYDEPIIKIFNKISGKKMTLPYEPGSILDSATFRILDIERRQKTDRLRRELYYPTKFVSDLVSNTLINGREFHLHGLASSLTTLVRPSEKDSSPSRSSYEKYLPFLQWGEGDLASQEEKRKIVPSNEEKAGWFLYLTGLERCSLGFAEWSDADGIAELAKFMRDSDVETLQIAVALLYPDAASLVANAYNVKDILAKCVKSIDDSTLIDKIKYALWSNQRVRALASILFVTQYMAQTGKIDPIVYDQRIVGFRITTPYSAHMPKNFPVHSILERIARYLTHWRENRGLPLHEQEDRLEQKQRTMLSECEKEMERTLIDQGWRIIAERKESLYEIVSSSPGGFETDYNDIYYLTFEVTKLDEADWSRIAPLLASSL